MNLEDFSIDFLEQSLITVEHSKISQEDSITTDILDYLIDCGDISVSEICHYKVRGIKINAWNYEEETNSFELFTTIVKSEGRLTKVSDTEIQEAFKRTLNFFWSARNKKLRDKVDESCFSVLDLVQIIEDKNDVYTNLKVFVLTNGQASADLAPPVTVQEHVCIDCQIWDIERAYQHYLTKKGKQIIEIDFIDSFDQRLQCLRVQSNCEVVDSYIVVMPGKILAEIYGTYRQGLLEKNVRTFLQFKGKVNSGIRNTIRKDPALFFSYNNGISATADKVEVVYENNISYITKVENLQIVNGGQTTAAIYATSLERGSDLSEVFVQMKISVVNSNINADELVQKISKFANSQTAIKESDFSSNTEYQILVENLSRSIWIPSNTGGKPTGKWFYERTRGQYLDEQSKRKGLKASRNFVIEYPKYNKLSKTDLAKYEMSWQQRPHDVSKGAENNFKMFTKEFSGLAVEIDVNYYKNLIAKAVLFKEIDKIVAKTNLGGYKANMVSYIMALISYKTDRNLDLGRIWTTQVISQPIYNLIQLIVLPVWRHLNEPDKLGMNIGEWCKKSECWLSLKDVPVDISGISIEIQTINRELIINSHTDLATESRISTVISSASAIQAEIWFSIFQWSRSMNKFTPLERKLLYNLGVMSNRNCKLSLKQSKQALQLLNSASKMGFKKV